MQIDYLPSLIEIDRVEEILLELNLLLIDQNSAPQNTSLYKLASDNIIRLKLEEPEKWGDFYNQIQTMRSLTTLSDTLLRHCREHYGREAEIFNIRIRPIEPEDGRLYPFHQEYVDTTSPRLFTYWIALHDIEQNEGGLLIVPGDYQQLEHERSSNSFGYPILPNQEGYRALAKEITFNAGDTVVFDQNVIHGSACHFGENIRFAVIFRASLN